MSMKFTSKNNLTRIFERLNLIFSKKTDIVDNLTSSDTDKPLSAKQGKVLKSGLDELTTNMTPLTEEECDAIISATSTTSTE